MDPTPNPSTPAAVAAARASPSLAAHTDLGVTHEASGMRAALDATLVLPPDIARDTTLLTDSSLSAAGDVTAADGLHARSHLLQQQIYPASSGAPGRPAAVSTAEAMALQQPSLDKADDMLVQTLSQTDAVPSLTLLSTAQHAAVMEQTAAAVELLGAVASPQAAALDLCADSAPRHAGAMPAKGSASASQPIQALLQLGPLSLATPTQMPAQLRSSETAPLHRAVSESASTLLSASTLQSLDLPVQPKRRSLLSRLRPSKGGVDLGRTASDPALLMRQSSADLQKLKSPTKRLSLSALLRRGSSGDATAAVVDPTAVASGGSAAAATAAGASPEVVGSLASQSSTVTTAELDQTQSSSQLQGARPLLNSAISSGTSLAQTEGLQPQSAPASPRGRASTAPPKGSAVQPDVALGRAVSDPSMLARLSSGMHSVPATPRRMSLLGRLSRGRRSNSIMPEPATSEQAESAQNMTVDEIPFAEHPFAEQPLAEQPSAEQLSVGQPFVAQPVVEQLSVEQPSAEQLSVEQPSAEQPLAEQPSAEQPLAEQPLAEQPLAEQPLAEQPSAEQPLAKQPSAEQLSAEQLSAEQPSAEQPSAEQPSAEQPLAATSLPRGAQGGQQLHEEQHLADLAELSDVAGEPETPPLQSHYCCISVGQVAVAYQVNTMLCNVQHCLQQVCNVVTAPLQSHCNAFCIAFCNASADGIRAGDVVVERGHVKLTGKGVGVGGGGQAIQRW